ncbi:MAG: gluconate 2-dehydrogenase subunit 3 family protein [Acidobacteria bacterium]|nr:gluconate 2-dehydrogenase subunit 3 family protein [Acidobacteriota bacterium]MBS1865970.1 gluconate 2-dehydrogenase subunit 3 family protein [Acidobacteriota bacterium]
MLKTNLLSIVEEAPKSLTFSRREAARILLSGMAVGAVLPLGATDHPIWKHFEDEHLMHRAEFAMGEGKLQFLNGEQFASFAAMAEVLVPGSTKAKSANFVDLLLSVGAEKARKDFVESLAGMEGECKKKFGKAFAGLAASEKSELFSAVSEKSDPLHAVFLNLKEWASGAYYSSEIGMRELGWTPDRVFAEFPGCAHAEGHD